MAEIRRITRSSGLSNFRQAAPEGGNAFTAFADMANQAYDFLKPAAMAEMAESGDEAGREMARQQIGQSRPPVAAPGTAPAPGSAPPRPAAPDGDIAAGIVSTADALGMDPQVLGSIVSFETGGTFDPLQKGPTTKWGQHRGLIQFGEPQAQEYGVDWDNAAASQLGPNGAIANYFRKNGWKAGMSELDAYSIVNAGGPGRYSASDTAAGGTAGTVADKVRDQFGPHRDAASAFLAAAIGGDGNSRLAFPEGTPSTGDGSATTLPGAFATPPGAAPASPAAPMSSQPAPGVAPQPTTMVRTAAGKLEPRLYSPLSGEILQAHNAAASTAYLAEMMVSGRTDMMGMANEFPLNPDGFQQASREYIDSAVKAAPGPMRRDLRANLEQEAQRRHLGMVEERHTDIRRRADNSSSALVTRWSEDYSEALASDNAEEAAAARSQLETILYAREALPGVAWTRDQSINTILGAQKSADALRTQRAKAQSSEWKDSLDLIVDARKAGRSAADETILQNPDVWAAQPELAAEAAAMVEFGESVPDFNRMTPDQQDAYVTEMNEQPVTEDYQIWMGNAATRIAAENRKAWDADPIARASEVLDQPAPEIPEFNPAQPEQFIAGLEARREYGNALAQQGFIERPTYLTDQEVDDLSLAMGPDVPHEARLAIAAGLSAGFGPDAAAVFDAIETDPTTRYAGKMLSRGGDMAVASSAMRGQQLIDEGLVSMPERDAWNEGFPADVVAAIDGLPVDSIKTQAEISTFARGIYASRLRQDGDLGPAERTAAIADAVQTAMGQSKDKRGRVTGGVQEVLGQPVLLPMGVAGVDVVADLDAILGTWSMAGRDPFLGLPIAGRATASLAADLWSGVQPAGASPSAPHAGGQPLPASMLTGGDVRLIPTGGNTYRMQITRSGSQIDVATADGDLFILDLDRLRDTAARARTGAAPLPASAPTIGQPGIGDAPTAPTGAAADAPPAAPVPGSVAPPEQVVSGLAPAAAGDAPPSVEGTVDRPVDNIVPRAETLFGSKSPEMRRLRAAMGSDVSQSDRVNALGRVLGDLRNLPASPARDALLAEVQALRNREGRK